MFKKEWKKLIDGEQVGRTFVALVCGILAHALLLAPQYSPASRLPIQSNSKQFCAFAHQLIYPPDVALFEGAIPGIEELQVQCLINTYMSFSGRIESVWTEVGRAMRHCKALQLYEEDKNSIRDLSDWEIELRRRIAWETCLNDRWLCLFYLRMPDLPYNVRTPRPNDYSDDSYDVDTGRYIAKSPEYLHQKDYEAGKYLLSDGAHRVSKFLYDFGTMQPAERYMEARVVETFLSQLEESMPASLNFGEACNVAKLGTPEGARLACQSLIAYTSTQRLRCTVMRQFLLDRQAPLDLRIAALEHARKIIEVTPVLITLSSSPWVSFHSSWCSGHLFCAASTFAIVFLGEMEDDLQDLNWFASKIFEVIEALSFLGKKDRAAARCEELLTALCTSKDRLRERFLSSKSGRSANGGQGKKKREGVDFNVDDPSFIVPRSRSSQSSSGSVLAMSPTLTQAVKSSPSHEPGHWQQQVTTVVEQANQSMGQYPQTTLPPAVAATTSTAAAIPLSGDFRTSSASYFPTTTPTMVSPNGDIFDSPTSMESLPNWPLLNDQQWSSLLDTLELDMNSLGEP
jgi:hypothetical protein